MTELLFIWTIATIIELLQLWVIPFMLTAPAINIPAMNHSGLSEPILQPCGAVVRLGFKTASEAKKTGLIRLCLDNHYRPDSPQRSRGSPEGFIN